MASSYPLFSDIIGQGCHFPFAFQSVGVISWMPCPNCSHLFITLLFTSSALVEYFVFSLNYLRLYEITAKCVVERWREWSLCLHTNHSTHARFCLCVRVICQQGHLVWNANASSKATESRAQIYTPEADINTEKTTTSWWITSKLDLFVELICDNVFILLCMSECQGYVSKASHLLLFVHLESLLCVTQEAGRSAESCPGHTSSLRYLQWRGQNMLG